MSSTSSSSDVLKCDICPRKPRFSDVSHLLTHISSKGHLSHYFKLQVRSHKELEAGDALAAYDDWYQKYNLAGLLSDRLRAKDARGRGNNSSGGGRGGRGGIKRESRASVVHEAAAPMSNGNFVATTTTIVTSGVPPMSSHLAVDPRLSQPQLSNATGRPQTYPLSSISLAAGRVDGPMPHAFAQAPPAWPLASQPAQLPSLGSWKRETSPENEDPVSPLAQRSRGLRRSARRANKRRSRRRPVSPDPFVDDDASFEQDEEDEYNEPKVGDEMTRLKGILWPGMDLFDAATEQMKRKRNQKKDSSVLKKMEKTSQSVEATEMVFSPNGTLRRERYIDGNVDETDLLPGETPLPKTRAPRRRRLVPPLPSINAGFRAFSRQQDRRLNSASGLALLESPMDPQPAYTFCNYVSPDSSDFSFAYAEQAQRPTNGFTVFTDDSQSKQHTHSRPGGALADTTNFGRDTGNYPAPFGGMDHQSKGYLPQDSKYQPRTTGFPPGKENIDPVLGQAGRVDMRAEGTSWGGQQYTTASPQYSSNYTYSSNYPTAYAPFGDHDAFGYPYNPLSYQFGTAPQSNGKDFAPSNDFFVSPDHKAIKEERGEISPDGTVSDMDREDVSRLYLATISG